VFSSRRAKASKELPLLELFVDFFERGFGLVLALFERLLGGVLGEQRSARRRQQRQRGKDTGPAGKKGTDIIEFAQRRGIILRGESPKYGSEGWFRVTIGNAAENRMVVGVIREFFSS